MNCIIIEDEKHAADHLQYELARTGYDIDVLTRIDSTEKAVSWLRSNDTDFIFLDIQLSDGLSFDIFDHVQVDTPVIFTTSYDQYAIKAFDLNSIAYLLKPVSKESLKMAIDKYKMFHADKELHEKIASFHPNYQKRFLVHSGHVLKTIPVEEVSSIQVQKKYVVITTGDHAQYVLESTLDMLEQRLDPDKFFRINRQFIIGIDFIDAMHPYTKGRLKIDMIPATKEMLIVGTDKAPAFKIWVSK